MPDLTIPWDEVETLKKALEHHLVTRGPSVLFRLDPTVSIVAVKVAVEQICLEQGCSLVETRFETPDPYVRLGVH